MSTTSATPPATRRIARSYLTDLVAVIPLPSGVKVPSVEVMAVVDQLLDRAVQVRHVLRSDQLVLTFDLADDPAGWSTSRPATPEDYVRATATAVGVDPDAAVEALRKRTESRDYPGQPGELVQPAEPAP